MHGSTTGSEDEYDEVDENSGDAWRHRELAMQRHIEASTAKLNQLVGTVDALQAGRTATAAAVGGPSGDREVRGPGTPIRDTSCR